MTIDDYVEIYYCLSSSEVDADELIGTDGEKLEEHPELIAQNLEAIRDAVESKLDAVKSGFYGKDRCTRLWASHLREILDELNTLETKTDAHTLG